MPRSSHKLSSPGMQVEDLFFRRASRLCKLEQLIEKASRLHMCESGRLRVPQQQDYDWVPVLKKESDAAGSNGDPRGTFAARVLVFTKSMFDAVSTPDTAC